MTKACTTCGEVKPVTEFYRNRRAPDGLQSHCKACHNSIGDAWAEKNREKRREYGRAWYGRSREKEAARKKARYWDDPEAGRQVAREWRQANLDQAREADARWLREHPEQHRAHVARRKARKIDAQCLDHVACQATDPYLLLEQQWPKPICYLHMFVSGEEVRLDWNLARRDPRKAYHEHLTPLSRGGIHCIDNLLPSCLICNSAKHDQTMAEFLASRAADSAGSLA